MATIASRVIAGEVRNETKGVDRVAGEMRKDYQVRFAELILRANVESIQVNIEVDGTDDPRAEALAEHIRELWGRTLANCYNAIGEGRQAFEKVWDFDPKTGLNIFHKLEPLPYHMTEMMLDDGVFQGVKLKAGGAEAVIPADKAWWLAIDATAINPYGTSRYLGAPYEVWQQRKDEFKNRKTLARRFAIKGGVVYAPETANDRDGNLVNVWEKLAGALDNLYSGGTLFLPPKTDNDGKRLYDFSELDHEATDPTPIETLIEHSDVRMLRAFGIPEKTVIEGAAVGSFAMVSQQMQILFAVVEDILGQFVDSFQRYVIDKLVEANFGERSNVAITARFARLSNRPDTALRDVVRSLVDSPSLGPLVSSGAVDVGELLRVAGIPLADDADDRIRMALSTVVKKKLTPDRQDLSVSLSGVDVPRITMFEEMARIGARPYFEGVKETSARVWRGEETATAIIRAIDRLRLYQAQVRIASRIIGALSIWHPELRPASGGMGTRLQPTRVDMSLGGDLVLMVGEMLSEEFIFPWLSFALDFLIAERAITKADFLSLSSAEKEAAMIGDFNLIKPHDLLTLVAESLSRGDSYEEFSDHYDHLVDVESSEVKTIFRTETKQAYNSGMRDSLEKPHVKDVFGWVLYRATQDTRVRPHHGGLDGFVISTDDVLYEIAKAVQEEYNCRCDFIPITEDQIESFGGVKTVADIPEELKPAYMSVMESRQSAS